MDGIYKNIDECNPGKECKSYLLIVLMIWLPVWLVIKKFI